MPVFLVDGSSDHLFSDLARSAVDIAYVVDENLRWDGKSLSIWSERVVVAVPESRPLANRHAVYWSAPREKIFLLPQRGPGPEFLNLLISKLGGLDPRRIFTTMCRSTALSALLAPVMAVAPSVLSHKFATLDSQ